MEVKREGAVFCGGIHRDFHIVASRFPMKGETLFGSKYFTGFGGKCPNQAVMCKRLGEANTKVSFIGKLGDDENGRANRDNFHQIGVDTTFVGTAPKGIPSGVASIWVNSNTGENMIIIVPGANEHLVRADIEKAESLFKTAKYLSVTLESNTDGILAALQIAKRNNLTTVMNAAPARQNLSQAFFDLTDILCVNETEAIIFAGYEKKLDKLSSDKDIENVMEILLKKCSNVIITRGEKGAAYASRENYAERYKKIDAPTIDKGMVVDTAGAGDAFSGALVYFLVQIPKLKMDEVIKRACYVASISIQKEGTQGSYPLRKDLPPWLFQ